MNILEEIVGAKRVEVAQKINRCSLEEMQRRASGAAARPDFVEALRATSMGVIAEIKRRSPSAGEIRSPFDPEAIARAYTDASASAISCLVDHAYFGGGEKDFLRVRNVTPLPMLYKEFVVDPWQLYHAKSLGASAVLLIAAVLSDVELKNFMGLAVSLDLCPLVEIHDAVEMQRAVGVGATCIGINNRNLKTFMTTLDTTFELATQAPHSCTLISESGIREADDLIRLKEAGAHAVLVGESLLRSDHPGLALQQLQGSVNG